MKRLLLAVLLIAATAVFADDLVDAAKAAKAKRKKSTTKVITDADLRRAGAGRPEAPVSSSEAAATEAAPAEGAAPAASEAPAPRDKAAKTEDELRAEAETKWRERLQQARNDVSRLSAEAGQLQLGLNDLTQNLYGVNRVAAMNRLDEVKKQLAAAQASVADLEEEGRRSRFRP